MIDITVNGEKQQIEEISILQYLQENGYENQRVAVEVNGFIVPRNVHNETLLHAGDVVEVVSFVGGG